MVTAIKIILPLLQAHIATREGFFPPGLPRLCVRWFAAGEQIAGLQSRGSL